MRQRAFAPTLQDNSSATEVFSHVTLRQGGKVAIARYVPAPFKALLSEEGVLSWQWNTTPAVKERHSGRVLSSAGRTPRKVPARLWSDFVRLADAGEQEFLAFAERWGSLGEPSIAVDYPPYSERLEGWRSLARLARALLNCSVAMGQAKPGAAEDWEQICKWLKLRKDPDLATSIEGKSDAGLTRYRRVLLTQALNLWYERSPGNTLIGWQNEKMVIEPAVTSLFGIIGIQLAHRIVGTTEMLVCYHCTRFFTPQRKPTTGQRVFCPQCKRTSKPQMYAMRDFRSRSKRAVQ